MYPALVVAEALHDRNPSIQLTFAGSVGGFDERALVEKSGVSFVSYHEVQAGPLHGINPLRAVRSLVKLAAGTIQAWWMLGQQRPQAIFTTGGWVSFPVAFAAWLRRVPLVVYLPDIEPGLTIKVLRRFAVKVCVTTPDSVPYFNAGQMMVTGYPLRRALLNADRAAAIQHFRLDARRKTLLVFGGSLGSRNLNVALINALSDLLREAVQVIHVTGSNDYERCQEQVAALPSADLTHYHPYPYLHDEMGLAFAAADLVVCRSGASTLGELPHFALPAILVPYPYAWRYQKVNADYLAERGAARVMRDEDLGRDLLPTVRELLQDTAALTAMQTSAKALAQPDAAGTIAEIILAVGKADLS